MLQRAIRLVITVWFVITVTFVAGGRAVTGPEPRTTVGFPLLRYAVRGGENGHMTTAAPTPVAGRFRLLGWSFVLLLLSNAANMALLVMTVVGLSLVVITVGIPLFGVGVWLTRHLTDAHRWIFGTALGVKIPRPYRPLPDGHIGRKLLGYARDPATWRDVAWLVLNSTVGFAAYVLVISLFSGVIWYPALPLLWWILESGPGPAVAVNVLRTEFGSWAIDSQQTAFVGIPIGLVFLALWWWLTPPVLRGYARLSRTLLGPTDSATLAARVQQLTESRAETVDAQAAELRRIERDLHDGAQARLVSLGMSLGMAEEVLRTDPDAAARLLAEAREDSGQALAELRQLVRGMHPPVLADRGLPGAAQALALAHPLPVEVVDELPGRPPAPVESAAYFAIAETLTNVAKHARARSARVRLGYDGRRLLMTVSDDGQGGARLAGGGGLHGVSRRLSAFDGIVNVTSPVGGPTVIAMEIPCELSPASTTPSA
jgi:signal transduction histidine kinase